MSQIAITGTASAPGGRTVSPLVQSAGERIALRIHRIVILLAFVMIFFPPFNPGRISGEISGNLTLLTSATSFGTITTKLKAFMVPGLRFALNRGDVIQSMIGCAMVLMGVILAAAGACISLGNRKMRRIGVWFPLAGSILILVGLYINRLAYDQMNAYVNGMQIKESFKADHLEDLALQWPSFANTAWMVAAVLILASGAAVLFQTFGGGKPVEEKAEMPEKYRLFIMFVPVLLLSFVFAYLPIYGWRYAFYNAKAGDELTRNLFVGFDNFKTLINDPGTSANILSVLRNTLIMSGLGIATSWLPIAFAVLLAEIRSTKFQRTVQTLTTIPNFLSWVLVYAVALSIFAPSGLLNNLMSMLSTSGFTRTDYLSDASYTWIKMLLWGTHCIWHITIPGLIPTYMVMLLMSIAGILSNGMEQYLVFANQNNRDVIEVLDLYVYNLGIKSNNYSISTVVGMLKSVIAVILLFGANGISKAVRGESII